MSSTGFAGDSKKVEEAIGEIIKYLGENPER